MPGGKQGKAETAITATPRTKANQSCQRKSTPCCDFAAGSDCTSSAPAGRHEKIRRRLEIAKAGHLRQCLYRTRFDRWLKQRLNWDRGTGWRLDYSK